MVQHERARAVQPAHEAATDRRHVDQRKRVQQAFAALTGGNEMAQYFNQSAAARRNHGILDAGDEFGASAVVLGAFPQLAVQVRRHDIRLSRE